jgi:hypothetical protein
MALDRAGISYAAHSMSAFDPKRTSNLYTAVISVNGRCSGDSKLLYVLIATDSCICAAQPTDKRGYLDLREHEVAK